MSKRSVTYIKPDEPSFLKRIKEQVGYKEGPTVDTKRENLGPVDDADLEDTREELPTVVVLQPGDLTAEEAASVKELLEKEEEESPADLSKPILFKAPSKSKKSEETEAKASKRSSSGKEDKKSKKAKSKALLSFDEDEEDCE